MLSKGWQDAVDGWCRWLTAAGKSKRTIRTRRGHVEAVARYTSTRHPAEIDLAHLIAVFGERDYSLEHRRGARTSLTQFFDWCVINVEGCDQNPALGLPHVPEDKPRPKPAPDWLWDEALAVAAPREKLMIRLAGELGLRREEICRVHSDDVLWDGRGFALRVDGKGGKQRVVPISDYALGEQLQRCRGWVFPSVDRWGNRIADHLSADRVGRLVSDVLGPGWSCHKLRHRFATRGYAGTRNLRGVQVALGHASVATTQRYTAVVAEDVRAVVEAAAS